MNNKKYLISLGFLILIFVLITLLITNNNSFIISLDNSIHSWIASHQSSSAYNFMLSITNIGDVLGTIIIFLVFGLFLFLKKRNSFCTFVTASISGVILTEIIKYSIQRARPYNLLESGYSLPSAHAMISTVFLFSSLFLVAPLIYKRFSKNTFIVIVSIIFPLVAFSRICLSVHFASDVIAGIILGSICFISAELLCCHKKENVL